MKIGVTERERERPCVAMLACVVRRGVTRAFTKYHRYHQFSTQKSM